MLFGLPLAVTQPSTGPFLLQATLRRCFALLLCSFYYDDAVASQEVLTQVMVLVGYPFASAKRQGPSRTGDFLGLVHDFSSVVADQQIHVWIRERPQCKILDVIATAQQTGQLHPGTAAKLYGCVTFLDQAVFGKIARAGLNAIKERQYLDHTAHLTSELQRSFDTIAAIAAVLTLAPRRTVCLSLSSSARIAGASDAAQDATLGSGVSFLAQGSWSV